MSQDVLVSPEGARHRYDARIVVRAAVAADLFSRARVRRHRPASHEDGLSASGLVETAWPFVVGVIGGWAGVFIARMAPLSFPAAAMMLVKTVILGCVVRVVFTDGNAPCRSWPSPRSSWASASSAGGSPPVSCRAGRTGPGPRRRSSGGGCHPPGATSATTQLTLSGAPAARTSARSSATAVSGSGAAAVVRWISSAASTADSPSEQSR